VLFIPDLSCSRESTPRVKKFWQPSAALQISILHGQAAPRFEKVEPHPVSAIPPFPEGKASSKSARELLIAADNDVLSTFS
jgi:hypothetical protein